MIRHVSPVVQKPITEAEIGPAGVLFPKERRSDVTKHYTHDQKYGPATEWGDKIHALKYRGKNENFYDAMSRVAAALADSEVHRKHFKGILLNQRFMPGGRIQSAVGAPRRTTPYNCFLSGVIEDSMKSIMGRAGDAAQTMRMGGGIGYDFSRLRPRGDLIKTLESPASGPISFMGIFDAVCRTVSSSGHRRGAQMAVLRCDHPDIEEFVRSKQNETTLTAFNISVGVTDKFMKAVKNKEMFDLVFDGRAYKQVDASYLWDEIMRSTWDWAEPGVLFIDRINEENNLYYCETIEATNPCAEQPLPPFGACLLGSFNLTKYLFKNMQGDWEFDADLFKNDIPPVIRAMDNVVDKALYPLKEQMEEAKNKRRMGIGVTGLANTGEALGFPYASPAFLKFAEYVLKVLRDHAYGASADLAEEKGPFPLFDSARYLEGKFVRRLPGAVLQKIAKNGIRNSHLLSIAPTGTISLSSDNVSSGVEPVFEYEYIRTIDFGDTKEMVTLQDYGVRFLGVEGKKANEISAREHLDVLMAAQKYVDSAVSKTCNVGDVVSWDEFKTLYYDAWKSGAKGVTTFRPSGKRFGILNKKPEETCAGGSCDI